MLSKEVVLIETIDITNNNEDKENKDSNLPTISKYDISYNEFFWKYMKTNQPVVINLISNNWISCNYWVNNKNEINFEYLKKNLPNVSVPVVECSLKNSHSNDKKEMMFLDFLQYWEKKIQNVLNEPLYYLKDWHLKKLLPNYKFYDVPLYFASDWLNEYLIDNEQDDYMFVYMGPKGTWTPLHSDVCSSFSWSTNIVGKKKWLLLPPGEEIKLKDNLGNLPYSVDEFILTDSDCKYIEIIQTQNQTLFVPSGWYHQVWNLEETISINHNWFNSCNISKILGHLKKNLLAVKKEMIDLKDADEYEEHCQIILKSLDGFNFKDLCNILKYILNKRLRSVEVGNPIILFNKYQLGVCHIQNDILVLEGILKEILENNLNVIM